MAPVSVSTVPASTKVVKLNPEAPVFFPGERASFVRQTLMGTTIQVSHPLSFRAFQRGLAAHPDKQFVADILRILMVGADIGVQDGMVGSSPGTCRNSQSADACAMLRSHILEDVDAGSKRGPFGAPPFAGFVCSPIAVIPRKHSDKKVRIIHNLSAPVGESVNSLIPDESATVEYATFDSATMLVQKCGRGAFMAKVDLSNAYKHVVVRPDQWHYLGLHVNPRQGKREFYFDVMLPFGCRSSCSIFTKFTNAVLFMAKQRGVENIFGYLDDFFIVEPTEEKCQKSLEVFIQLVTELGFLVNRTKCEGPARSLKLLGIEIDSQLLQLRLDNERLAEMRDLLADWTGKRIASKREVASLIGKLQFASLVCYPGRAFLRRMIELLKIEGDWDSRCVLDRRFFHDLLWWKEFLPDWNGVSLFPEDDWVSNADMALFTDACGEGFAAFFAGQWLYGKFDAPLFATVRSMPFKELFAIVAAVATWGPQWAGKMIRFHTDCFVVAQVLTLRRAKAPMLAALLRLLYLLCARFHCRIGAVHIPGVETKEADLLSRGRFHEFFQLVPGAARSPTPVPYLLNSVFFSEFPGYTVTGPSDSADAVCQNTGNTETCNDFHISGRGPGLAGLGVSPAQIAPIGEGIEAIAMGPITTAEVEDSIIDIGSHQNHTFGPDCTVGAGGVGREHYGGVRSNDTGRMGPHYEQAVVHAEAFASSRCTGGEGNSDIAIEVNEDRSNERGTFLEARGRCVSEESGLIVGQDDEDGAMGYQYLPAVFGPAGHLSRGGDSEVSPLKRIWRYVVEDNTWKLLGQQILGC